MKAIRVSRFGDSSVLKLVSNLPIPQPNKNQILVKVSAAGVNPIDTYIHTGTHSIKPPLPYTPGMDAAGVVQEVGNAVADFKAGDRVYTTCTVTGAYGEYLLVQQPYIAHLPDRLSFQQGAAIGIPYYTAYRALVYSAKCRPGDTVLIHGASGGVGVAACQLARSLGLRVLGTAGTAEGMKLVSQNGAHLVFNHRESGYLEEIKEVTKGEGPDIILEMLANVNLENDLNLVKAGGRIVVIGCRGSAEISPRLTMAKECFITGVLLLIAKENEWIEMHSALQAGLENGALTPLVGKSFQLEDAGLSHLEIMKDSGHSGKIVLTV